MLYTHQWAIVVHNGSNESMEYAKRILEIHNIDLTGVVYVSTPFSQPGYEVEYDERIIDLTITAVLVNLARHNISGNRVIIVCSHEWDIQPAGEIAGALAQKADILFYYPDGRMALPDSSVMMTSAEANRVFRQIWGFDTRLANTLRRANIYPSQLLIMPEIEIRLIKGVGDSSVQEILHARDRIRQNEEGK